MRRAIRAGILLVVVAACSVAVRADAGAFVRSQPVGDTHNCASFYPREAARNFEEGDVIVRYNVDADGNISNVAIDRSSGNLLLDDAAVACVSKAWKSTPSTEDGKPIESSGLRSDISFKLAEPATPFEFVYRGEVYETRGFHDRAIADFTAAINLAPLDARAYHDRAAAYDATGRRDLAMLDLDKLKTIPLPPRTLGPHGCAAYYPDESRRAGEAGNVVIGYDVDADGIIGNITVKRSSGFKALDDASLACVHTWKDTPAMLDGKPIASPGHEAVISFSIY